MPLKSAKRSGVLRRPRARAARVSAQQIVDQRLGMDFFLDVERRGVDDEVAPVLLVLAAPDELRIEIACCARYFIVLGFCFLFLHHRLVFGCRDVFPLGSSCLSVSTVLLSCCVSWPWSAPRLRREFRVEIAADVTDFKRLAAGVRMVDRTTTSACGRWCRRLFAGTLDVHRLAQLCDKPVMFSSCTYTITDRVLRGL